MSNHILTIYQPYTNHSLAPTHLPHMFATCSVLVRYLSSICPVVHWTYTGHIPSIYRTYTGHVLWLIACCMVAAPGVPGGAVMAALAPLAGILGFNPDAQALMIALYIAMDSFGTACNVTGDGALAIITEQLHKNK